MSRRAPRSSLEKELAAWNARVEAVDRSLVELVHDRPRWLLDDAYHVIDMVRDCLALVRGPGREYEAARVRVRRMQIARLQTSDRDPTGFENAQSARLVRDAAQEIKRYEDTGQVQLYRGAADGLLAMLAIQRPKHASKLRALEQKQITTWLLAYVPKKPKGRTDRLTLAGITARILCAAKVTGFADVTTATKRLEKNLAGRDLAALGRAQL